MDNGTFFEKCAPAELGSTKYVGAGAVAGTRGNNQKMIDVSCDDAFATDVTVSVRTEEASDPATGLPATGGPIVATLQWGVGGSYNELEFDVPPARMTGNIAPAGDFPRAPMALNGGGVQVYLAGASHVSLYVRNDSSQSPLVSPGVGTIGFTANAKVHAFVGPGGSQNSKVERQIILSTFAQRLAPGASVAVTVPPFAKSVRFERSFNSGLVEPLQLDFFNSLGQIFRRNGAPTNGEGPFDISAQTIWILVTNIGASDMQWCSAVFDVTPT